VGSEPETPDPPAAPAPAPPLLAARCSGVPAENPDVGDDSRFFALLVAGNLLDRISWLRRRGWAPRKAPQRGGRPGDA
jgi:hypothetical protein